VTIHNTGDANDTYDLEVIGAENFWVNFSQDEIFIVAEDEKTVSGTVSIPKDAEGGNKYIEILATSRNDQKKQDEKVIRVEVVELETGATLVRIGEGQKTIEPGASDTFEFTIVSDGNSDQEFDIMVSGEAGVWATSSISEITMKAEEGTEFNVTVTVPAETVDGTYRLVILIISDDKELAKSTSNVVVKAHIEEIVDVVICLTEMSGVCLTSGEFEITIESSKIQTASIGFLIENRGNVDAKIALELMMPDGSTGSDLYFDENSKEWRVAVSPADTTTYPLEIDVEESMDWGALAVIAREVLPGSYTFTLKLMLATETNAESYAFKTLETVTITVIVEGNAPQEESSEEEGSLLPGSSLLSVILVLIAVVYRRRR